MYTVFQSGKDGKEREIERERDDIKKKVRVFTYILARDIIAER